ncbi:YncE family protein [Acidobacteria bacterium AH-259-O06]|nr:YncE family protein [Acidobacteria bacterium AH-259-O06]
MKPSQIRDPNNLNRRDFITGMTTAGLTYGLLLPSTGLAAESSPATVKRLLYVTNNKGGRVDIFDIAAGHTFVRSFPMAGENVGGICADAASSRLFITQQSEDTVTAYDVRTGKVLWTLNTIETFGLDHPDRPCITTDGSALYVPMKGSEATLVLDTSNGERIAQFDRPGRPHNSWSGEQGRYMYVAGRSHHTMYLTDQRTHKVVKKIGPFSWPIRPFSVDPAEHYIYANLTYLHGFGVGDIETGEITEVHHLPPWERMQHWSANGGLPHGDHPFSHGIAVRPGSQEVWHLDDQWGYLNIFDTSKSGFAPEFKGHIELFDEIDQPWGKDHGNRWLAFNLDGKYCYPSDGLVVDAEAGKLTSMRISPSEKLIEVEFRGDTATRVSGQMGGVYGAAV